MSDLIHKIKTYCGRKDLGGTLHFLLYDLQTDDKTVLHCIDNAKKHKDYTAISIAEELQALTKEERHKIIVEAGVSWMAEL